MNSQPTLNLSGALFALAAVILWSGNFIVARALAGQVPPFTLALIRWGSASLIILPLCWKGLVAAWPYVKTRWLSLFIASLTASSAYSSILYFAAESTNVLNMTLIATTAPIFALILGRIFLKEALMPLRVAGIFTALIGVVALAVRGDIATLLALEFHFGDLLTLCATLLFAIYTIHLRYRPFDMSPLAFTAALSIMAFLTLIPFSIWELVTTGTALRIESTSRLLTVICAVLYLGAGASVGALMCWTRAVSATGPGNAMLFYYTMPFFSGVEAVLLLGEPVLWVHWVSGALILCGILVATRSRAA